MGEPQTKVCENLRNVQKDDDVTLTVSDGAHLTGTLERSAKCVNISTQQYTGPDTIKEETVLTFLVEAEKSQRARECIISVVDGFTTFRNHHKQHPEQSPLFDDETGDDLGQVIGVEFE